MRLAAVGPETAAVYRCLYALPVLGLLASRETRAFGPAAPRLTRLAFVAGALLAADLVLWHHAIEGIGAGLSTELGNLQVVIVPFVAFAVLGERPGRPILLALPVALAGIVLISGVVEAGAYGDDPVRGAVLGLLAGVTYAGFLLVLRQAGADRRRLAGPLFLCTVSATAVALAAALAVDPADLAPTWPAHGWLVLLALSSQVFGWLLITSSLPRLPAALTSVTLTIQPLGSVLLGIVLLGEEPSGLQLAGAACILAGLIAATRARAGETGGTHPSGVSPPSHPRT